MPKMTHTITATATTAWTPATGDIETIAVYGQADLDRRLAEARKMGVEVTVTPADDADDAGKTSR